MNNIKQLAIQFRVAMDKAKQEGEIFIFVIFRAGAVVWQVICWLNFY